MGSQIRFNRKEPQFLRKRIPPKDSWFTHRKDEEENASNYGDYF